MSTSDFYDQMSSYYHLIYPDWEESMKRQAGHLDQIIESHCASGGQRVLDAACGIGTQSLGLASLGYQLTGSDLSPHSIDRAVKEASDRGLIIEFSVADMTQAYDHHQQQFDVVLACDNAIPHLLTDAQILQALKQFYQCTLNGGCCVISVRDYSGEPRTDTVYQPYGMRVVENKKFVIFQVQEFHGIHYNVSMYFIEDDGNSPCKTYVMKDRYYSVKADRLVDLMEEAGFHEVHKIEGIYFQPVIVGKKPRSCENDAYG